MDMLLTWVIFGIVVALFSGMVESFSSREEMISASFLGIVGSVIGGAFGEAVVNSDIGFLTSGIGSIYHVSPLVFAVFGALIFITIAKNYPRIL